MGEIWFAGRELQIEEDAVLASPGFEWALQDDAASFRTDNGGRSSCNNTLRVCDKFRNGRWPVWLDQVCHYNETDVSQVFVGDGAIRYLDCAIGLVGKAHSRSKPGSVRRIDIQHR